MTDKKKANLAKTIAKLEDKIEIALKMLEMSKKDRLDAIEARLDALEAKAKPRISFNGTDEMEEQQPEPEEEWKAVYREAYLQAYGSTIQDECLTSGLGKRLAKLVVQERKLKSAWKIDAQTCHEKSDFHAKERDRYKAAFEELVRQARETNLWEYLDDLEKKARGE